MALYIRLRYFAVSDIQKMRYVNNQVRKQNIFSVTKANIQIFLQVQFLIANFYKSFFFLSFIQCKKHFNSRIFDLAHRNPVPAIHVLHRINHDS